MAQLSVSAAARAVGKDRGTIHRYIKSGKLSVSKNTAGHTVIETAELLRVFGALQGDGGMPAVAQHVVAPVENSSVQHILESTLELMKQQLKASQEREERLLIMLGQEQEARRELERRLLPPGTDGAEQTPEKEWEKVAASEPVIIPVAEPPATVVPQPAAKEEKKGFFATLFGR